MNFVCLKWGKRYSAEFVNKLYRMLKRYHTDFTLHCITEDPLGVDKNVRIIDLPDLGVHKWWNKMILFNGEFEVKNGIFLDLDLIVQENISLFYKPSEHMKFLFTDWIDLNNLRKITFGDEYKYCSINSSVLCWNENTEKNHIWEDFQINKEKILFLYKGIDNYIESRHKYQLFETGNAYSYWNCNEEYRKTPVILFDYEQTKQDKIAKTWILDLWRGMSYGEAKRVIRAGYKVHDSEFVDDAYRVTSNRIWQLVRAGKI